MIGEIARGGMGVVYKGRDSDLGREVAIKVLHEKFEGSAEVLERFVEEAQIGGQLQHPGIVPVYELGLDRSVHPYFSMKLVKGETLAAQLARRTDPSETAAVLLHHVLRRLGKKPGVTEFLFQLADFACGLADFLFQPAAFLIEVDHPG